MVKDRDITYKDKSIKEKKKSLDDYNERFVNNWVNHDVFYKKEWTERTKMMSEWIEPKSNVIEFGAGKAELKKMLPKDCQYTSTDINKRDYIDFVYDLNERPLKKLGNIYTVMFFAGVFEYIKDIPEVINHLYNDTKQIICSYQTKEGNYYKRNKFFNNLKFNEFKEIFTKTGFKLEDILMWNNHHLFNFIKKEDY